MEYAKGFFIHQISNSMLKNSEKGVSKVRYYYELRRGLAELCRSANETHRELRHRSDGQIDYEELQHLQALISRIQLQYWDYELAP